ncbi:gas vesicle protein K [Embleya sp. NPDC050493]|uniref:gas vesicle protein K n=1 Tax=Embleya sp. NPDC050493 TaxID=3363989 RepID=UPI00378D9642
MHRRRRPGPYLVARTGRLRQHGGRERGRVGGTTVTAPRRHRITRQASTERGSARTRRRGTASNRDGRTPRRGVTDRIPDAPPSPAFGRRIATDPETVERGLVSLVLTIVELLRQLMEKQAIRRIDHGGLTDDQIERMGLTLMALEERMAELREYFDLSPEDLNIDLGPLGPLLPRD